MNNPRASRRTSVEDALKMFTTNGAWVAHDEDAYGMLKPGLAADLVVLGGTRTRNPRVDQATSPC